MTDLVKSDVRKKIVLNNSRIRRTAFHDVVTRTETKSFEPVLKKRRKSCNHRLVLYGFKNN